MKGIGGQSDSAPYSFSKNVSSREKVKPCFFVTLNIFISYTFPDNFIEISQFLSSIWRIYSSVLTIFVNFPNFVIFLCYRKATDRNIQQMMTAFSSLWPTLNRLFKNCIKSYLLELKFYDKKNLSVIIYNVKHRYEFGDKLLASLTKLVLKVRARICSKIKQNLLLHCRKFLTFVITAII